MNAKIEFAEIPVGKPFDPQFPLEDRHASLAGWSAPLTPYGYWTKPSRGSRGAAEVHPDVGSIGDCGRPRLHD